MPSRVLITELLAQLPTDVRHAIASQWQLTQELHQREKKGLEIQIRLLREQLRLASIKQYGSKADQLNDDQLALLHEEPGVTAAEVDAEAARTPAEKHETTELRKRHHPGRAELPAHLPRVETTLTCTPEQCTCQQCGSATTVIGYDSCEELDVQPAHYFVRVLRREKRACKNCADAGVATAPAAEPKIIAKSKASNRVIVDVVISKYCNHQPLYRQCATLKREAGIDLSCMTLSGWVMQTGGWCEAICGAMREELLAGSYIQADETPVGVQSGKTEGRNHRGYLWEYSRPGGPVIFDFQMGRGRDGPRKFLEKFSGRLQCDGYGAYNRIGGKGITFCGCMAHMRRGFTDALKVVPDDAQAVEIVAEVAKLYEVEQQSREAGLTHGERLHLRQSRSQPVLQSLKQKILALRQAALPKSAMGKACDYALCQWSRLIVFASDGEVEIDNNWCENAMRPIALGRKNWLHIGSEEAGPRVAAITSIIETCRRMKINVREYLLDVLPRVPEWPARRIAELTPAAWAAARAESAR